MSKQLTWQDYFRLFLDKRFLIIFTLGMLSGFPWVLIGSAMTAWLKEAELTRTAIGFFGSIFVVYAFNFLWAPLLDSVKLPLLSRLGRRRSWILLMQILMLLLVLAIAFTDPSTSLVWTSILAVGIACVSATQDIAIDAFRIESLSKAENHKIPAGSAMATSGWWTGYSLPGALAFILSDQPGISWGEIYLILSLVIVLAICFIFLVDEPELDAKDQSETVHSKQRSNTKLQEWLVTAFWRPLSEFFVRNGMLIAVGLLSFIFLFKIGEAFLGRMSVVFYKEVGFSNTDIGIYSKLIGWWAIIIFSILASIVNIRFGIIKGLLISGIAMAATNLMFTWIALVGPNTNLFAVAVIVDNFTASFATVAFVSFISYLTNRKYTATQYALMASLGNLGRTTLASFSGLMVDGLHGNWALFFTITAFMVIPSLCVLWLIRRHI